MEENTQTESSMELKMKPTELEQLFRNPTVIKAVSNSFIVARTQNDIIVIPLLNGVPQLTINISFPSAKELLEKLQKNISQIEESIGEIKMMPA